jgi:hypothetical protein
MPGAHVHHEWLLLIHQLPPKPTNLRVRTWRKLQKLGAVAIKNSVYVLPFNEKTFEDFQWLAQEIESLGGEASVFRAGSVEGATDGEIVAVFNSDRDEAYAELTAALGALSAAMAEQAKGGHLTTARVATSEADLGRLHAELERLEAIDFFRAPGRARATAAYERARKALLALHTDRAKSSRRFASDADVLDIANYQGRRWVTRRNPHIDRLASAWLIKRFIDPNVRLFFVSDGESVPGGVGFDMVGGEFTHEGEDCTFETLIRRFGLGSDPGLKAIGEIVHDIDLKDGKFNRLEASGLNAVITGIAEHVTDDRKRVQHCAVVFDGLYALLGGTVPTTGRRARGKV